MSLPLLAVGKGRGCMASVAEPWVASSSLPDETIAAQVRRLLSATYQPVKGAQRRADQRFPYAKLVLLRPLDAHGEPLDGEPTVAVGKHLSERGIGFYHPGPMPHRLVEAEIDLPNGQSCRFVVELKWCRFTRLGWYESGGRFLALAASCENENGESPVAGITPRADDAAIEASG